MTAPAPTPPRPKAQKDQFPTNAKWLIAIIVGVVLLSVVVATLAIRAAGVASAKGFLGSRAGLLADINFSLEILLLIGLTVGYGLARRGNIRAHQYNQTAWVLFNIVLVVFIMALSFRLQVAPGIPAKLGRPYYWLSTVHAAIGGLTILSGIFILLRMNKLVPKALRVKWWKNLMRGTLVGYWLVGLLGVGTYYVWYTAPAGASGAPVAALDKNTVVVPVANYQFSPQTLTIPLGTKVIFVNQDPGPHTVTFDHGEFPSAGLDEGGQHEIVFDRVGTFQYYCEYHGSPGLHDMAGVIIVVAAGQAAVPTAVAPPAPTPEPTAAAIAAAPLGPVGFGQFRDAAARNDAFDLTLYNLPAGSGDLNVWLSGANGSLRLGRLTPDVNGAAAIGYVDPQGANLVAQYSSFVVTRETAGAVPSSPSATVVVGGGIPDGALGAVRQLLVASDVAPKSQALAIGMLKQTEELYRHVTAVNNAALAGDFDSLNRHAEHLFTIVEGKGGPEYRDFNDDGFITDPGDGFGIMHYADAIEAQAKIAAAAPDADDSVKLHAGHLIVLAQNMRQWGAQLVAIVIKAHQATKAADQQADTAQALTLAQAMLNGVDANNNGMIEPIAGEGGAYTLYFHSQYLAAMGATMR